MMDAGGTAPEAQEEEAERQAAPRVPRQPLQPTAAEVEEHEATGHASFRAWCPHCQAGRGRSSPYPASEKSELPEIGAGYGFF